MDAWNEAVLEAMLERGFTDPYQLIAGLLFALRGQHRHSILADTGKDFSDGLDPYTHQHATTVAESMAYLLRVTGTENQFAAVLEQEKGNAMRSNHLDYVGRGQAALADVLDYYLPVWTADGVEARERAGLKDERAPLTDSARGEQSHGEDDGRPEPEAN